MEKEIKPSLVILAGHMGNLVTRIGLGRLDVDKELELAPSKIVDFVFEILRETLVCGVDSVEPSHRERIRILEKRLRFLKGLCHLTERRCHDRNILNQLSSHVQLLACRSANLAYSCLVQEKDEHKILGLSSMLSDLSRDIDLGLLPWGQQLYVQVMKATCSLSTSDDSCTWEMEETVVDFLDSLLDKTPKLPHQEVMLIHHQVEILKEELTSFRCFLADAMRFDEPAGISNDVLLLLEDKLIEAGHFIYSHLPRESNIETRVPMLYKDHISVHEEGEMRLALSELLESVNLVDFRVRRRYVVQKGLLNLFPRTNELGAFHVDLLLWDLKELLLSDRVHSVILLTDEIHIAERDLEILGSFMNTIREQHHEDEKLEHIWNRIIQVVYKVEYVIGLAVVEYGPVLHHKAWFSHLIEEMNLIKNEICDIEIPETNMPTLQPPGGSIQVNAPRIDEEMVGFRDEEERVVEQLVWGSMQLQIVSIAGMPGLGKTFLAQKVYSNPTIKDQFYVQAWCKVSQVHERKELLINILRQVRTPTEEIFRKSDDEVAADLYRSLKGQKYLVVLDDMWNIEAWNELRRSFPDDNNGSRILFTSRFPNLALEAKPDSKIHHLRSFSPSESWELLEKKTFETRSCPLELVELGKQIAQRCNGLPLAIVVVGGLLARTRNDQEQWRKVASNLNLYIMSDPQRQCMDILDLSYKSLPDHLKACFLYLGAFPQGRDIPVVKLIRLWIAEGFIRANDPDLECVAERHLMDLISRSLVIASNKRSTGGVKTCILHDLVREFCLAKAKQDNFLKLIEECGASDSAIASSSPTSNEQRRVFMHYRDGKGKEFLFLSPAPFVHTLVLCGPRRSISLSSANVASILKQLRLVRVLDMMFIGLPDTFYQGIGLLAQLRYFTIYGNFKSLPPLITNLWNLETLIVDGVVEEISSSTILSLSKLRHLHTKSHIFSFDSSFDTLDNLQTLSTPSLSYGDTKIMIPNLRKLSCEFRSSWDSACKCNRLPLLDSLTRLESLKVSYFGPKKLPFAFSLPSSLKKLSLSRFRLPWAQISIIANLPNLELLRLHFKAFEGEEWIMGDGDFPKLKYLKLHFLNIERWSVSGDCFPPLERLVLERCFKLEEIPSQLEDIPTLKMIQVEYCGDSLLESIERIQEEQGDMENDELQVEIRRWGSN